MVVRADSLHHRKEFEPPSGPLSWPGGGIYDPSGDTWRRVADTNHFREYHAVTLLVPDVRIKFQIGPTSNDIEAFSPPSCFAVFGRRSRAFRARSRSEAIR